MGLTARPPVTPAVRMLRVAGVEFTDHLYQYQRRGGTVVSARELGVDEHLVVKTLVMEDGCSRPLTVLVHGDREVSRRNLARHLGVRSVAPCTPEVAQKHSGYLVGGTSPLGARQRLPVCMERSLLDLPRAYVNGGKRGYLVGIDPADLRRLLDPTLVDVAISPEDRKRA